MKIQPLSICTVALLSAAIGACLIPVYAATDTSSSSVSKASHRAQVNSVTSSRSRQRQSQSRQQTSTKSSVPAQASSVTKLGAITVTGLRESLESAESMKRQSLMVTDSVVAEDIGKLPDNSVAAAMQRIPGVQVAPDFQSEVTSVVIRGLPDVVTTLNGRNLFSSSGRSYAFQNLPATAVKSIRVYKTSNASLLDGGIAGVVNMELWRPFDFKSMKVSGTLKGVHSKYGRRTDPVGSLLVSDRWNTGIGDVGALIDFGYLQKHYDYNAVWGDVPVLLRNGKTNQPIRTEDGKLVAVPNALGADYNIGDRRRPEMNYAIQWAPSSNSQLYLEGLYDWDSDSYDQPFFFTDYRVVPGGGVVNPTGLRVGNTCYKNQFTGAQYEGQTICDANGAAWTGGTYAASSTQVHQEHGNDMDNALGFKWHNEKWEVSSLLNHETTSWAVNTFIIDTFLKGPLTTNWQGVRDKHQVWSLKGNPAENPDNFYFNGLFQDWTHQWGKANDWRADVKYHVDGNFLQQIQFGLRWGMHRSEFRGAQDISTPPPWGLGDFPLDPNPEDQVVKHFPSGYFCAMPKTSALPTNWLTGCYGFLAGNQRMLRELYGLAPGRAPENPGRTFNILERDYDAYVQLSFQNEIFGLPFQMLVGLRGERVARDLNAFSFNTSTGIYTPLSRSTTGMNYLPNVSFNLNLMDNLLLRLDAAKTLTYPAFAALNPSISLNPGTINRQGEAASGNPDLKPVKSDNYDASLEWYFNRSGYLSAAGFYRKISGYEQNFVTDVTIGGLPFQLSSPQSAGKGFLSGIELAYQQFFTFLPGAWKGLGIQLNYTRINGDVDTPKFIGGPVVSAPLQGVSRNNGNAVLMYQLNGWSARLAYDYRSRYIDGFNQPNVAGVYDEVELPNQVDFSLSYAFNKHLTAMLNATNLNHAVLHQFWGTGNSRPRDIRYTDRTIGIGVRVNF